MVGDNTSIWGGIVAVVVLLGLDFILREISRRSKQARKALEGEPRLLVRDGRLLKRAVQEEGLEVDDIMTAIRAHGLARVEDVRMAVLETDGSISVIGRSNGDDPEKATPEPPRRTATGA
jgi:uncharacterized membrane protein YcaP (DUF421 family)